MRVMWSDDPEAPAAIREALARSRNPNLRHVLIVDRGIATEAEVKDALLEFERRQLPTWFDEVPERRTLWVTPLTA